MDTRADLPPPGPAGMAGASGVDLADVLGQLAEGVAVVDAAGRLLYANAEAVRIWGYDDPGQVPGTWQGFEARFEVRDAAGEPVPAVRWPVALALAGEHLDDV
ncbi:MAG TPA: PAS domain-containing protein, partial [Actinomycetes bacterium]|nr:PAS domain-containing protein [Actinomycetes bacterium]